VDIACVDAGNTVRTTGNCRAIARVRPSSRKLKPRPADLSGSRVRVPTFLKRSPLSGVVPERQ
jgi:hypothetical protein